MLRKGLFQILFLSILFFVTPLYASEFRCDYDSPGLLSLNPFAINHTPVGTDDSSKQVGQLCDSLKTMLIEGNYAGSRLIVGHLMQKIKNNKDINNISLSESYYLIGAYYYKFIKDLNRSIDYYKYSAALREKDLVKDIRYSEILFNLGKLYGELGDFKLREEYLLNSLEIEKRNFS